MEAQTTTELFYFRVRWGKSDPNNPSSFEHIVGVREFFLQDDARAFHKELQGGGWASQFIMVHQIAEKVVPAKPHWPELQ